MKKLVTVWAMLVLFGTSYAMADWTTIDMEGAIDTCPFGISGNNIVGWYYDVFGKNHGFLYDIPTGSWTTLDVPGAIDTCLYDIDEGKIIGNYCTDTSYCYHGFLYDGNWTTLDMEGTIDTEAYGIGGNNIVGCYHDTFGKNHGFLYDILTGSWTTLDVPGANITYLYGISGNNIVGWYGDVFGEHGFLYDGNWTTLDMEGAQTHPHGIFDNNTGMSIVGSYAIEIPPLVYYHGFLYNTIPEPATVVILGLGLILLLPWRRR